MRLKTMTRQAKTKVTAITTGVSLVRIDAILRNDTPVIMAVTFVFACLVILFNLIADLLYGWLDPRIAYH